MRGLEIRLQIVEASQSDMYEWIANARKYGTAESRLLMNTHPDGNHRMTTI